VGRGVVRFAVIRFTLRRTLIGMSWRTQPVKCEPAVERAKAQRVAHVPSEASLLPGRPRSTGRLHGDRSKTGTGERQRISLKPMPKDRTRGSRCQQAPAPTAVLKRERATARGESERRVAGAVHRSGEGESKRGHPSIPQNRPDGGAVDSKEVVVTRQIRARELGATFGRHTLLDQEPKASAKSEIHAGRAPGSNGSEVTTTQGPSNGNDGSRPFRT
jgi:hypothetical protein